MLIYRPKKVLLFKLRDPERITSLIPTAKQIVYDGQTLVAVPHRIDETKVLNNLGFAVPSPINYYYEWAGRYTPFEAQQKTAGFLTMHNRAFVLSDLGTGKSLSSLWAYDYMRQHGQARRALVVSPLSTLERTWADEVFMHFPHLTYQVLHGTRQRRLRLLEQEADVYIVNHDGVNIIKEALAERDDIDLVIVDEISQAARNARTDCWKALNTVINKQRVRKAWGMTATPTPNEPPDAWAQCRLLVPERVSPYFTKFKQQVMRQVTQYKWAERDEAQRIVREAMQPAIRFARSECVDLPPTTYETREVGLTPPQEKAYKEMLSKLRAETEAGEITALNEAVKANKLLQICCGVAYGSSGEEVFIDAAPRLEAVSELVSASPSKTIVFVPFVSVVGAVTMYLRGKGFNVECIYGNVSKSERDRIFTAFQKTAEPQVIVAQPAAMSHGLTLTAASLIVWYAPINSNDTYEQANGRITRPGQKHNTLIVHLEGSTLERRMYERLRYKGSMQGVLLDLVREGREALVT